LESTRRCQEGVPQSCRRPRWLGPAGEPGRSRAAAAVPAADSTGENSSVPAALADPSARDAWVAPYQAAERLLADGKVRAIRICNHAGHATIAITEQTSLGTMATAARSGATEVLPDGSMFVQAVKGSMY
jgi:hypothetical protein